MLDVDLAIRWGSEPQLPDLLGRWRWFRDAIPPILQASAGNAGATDPVAVDIDALGKSFWAWAAALDRDRGLAPLDPVDFSHFLSGQLLYQLIVHHPVVLPHGERSRELFALTRTVLTVLAAWRMSIGAPMPVLQVQDEHSVHWPSFLENTAEDASSAVSFLDLFTGLEPVWQAPLLIAERPAVRRALAQRVQAHAPGAVQDALPSSGG
ncbi:hypothetical protein [Variovorax ginsengisoli]|uniref:Uncharacterized protein n=1 Tax=Variovorax ginsengisoli TaxID=363844 RepID=A0ABT9S672_9BURK|nr:hypothetical protein [Variovorax ginsengisoli]MDP9898832.1 hypothetical protein [Variovorax ginsengisoli]